jgi:hypothetical protein
MDRGLPQPMKGEHARAAEIVAESIPNIEGGFSSRSEIFPPHEEAERVKRRDAGRKTGLRTASAESSAQHRTLRNQPFTCELIRPFELIDSA